jgi:putative aminophosphonate oxidoreductase
MAPVRSLWLEEALAAEAAAGRDPVSSSPRLGGDVRADVCVVGGGYTGLWAALRLKELSPQLDVVVVEADLCGGGASGRNGGFVLSWWAKFHSLEKLTGTQDALRLARSSADAVVSIGKFCAEHGIDAHFHQDGWLWAATNPAQVGAWRATLEGLARVGEAPFIELTGDEAAARSGSSRHVAGVFEAVGAIVQPALLARGLRRTAVEQGVRVFERSPMTALELGPSPRVQTAAGTVKAERVILAMNAWAVRFSEIRRRILVIGSDIVATEPAPERLAQIGWRDGMSISDSRLLVHYYRTTDDGRIAFGKGGGLMTFGSRVDQRFEGASPRAAEVESHFRSLYPSLKDVRIRTSWTGPIDRSRTGLPFFARLGGRPDVVYGVGYSGNGVGPSFLGGKILASMALGLDDEWSGCGLARPPERGFPPEPFRFAGGSMVRAAIARKERAEDEGRRPNLIDVRLIRLAPPGLVPMEED